MVIASTLAVFAGGLVGTALRLGLDTLVPHGDDTFAFSTLVINVLGSFALGFLTARAWPTARPWVRAGLGPGLLGSFTTFSAVMVSLITLTTDGQAGLALVYLGLSLALGFGAAALGLLTGRRALGGAGRSPKRNEPA